MENYHYFWKIFSSREEPINSLTPFVARAEKKFMEAMKKYVAWNFKYEMPHSHDYFNKLNEQLITALPKDIPFTNGLSKVCYYFVMSFDDTSQF